MFSIFVSVNDVRKACIAATAGTAKQQAISKAFQGPAFFVEYNRLRFHTGVDRETWQAEFLLSVPSALQLVEDLERKLNTDLQPACSVTSKADSRKYDYIQVVDIPTAEMYKAIVKNFTKLAKQSKSQVMYADSRRKLLSATQYARPQSKGSAPVMFLSLDFEWWERSEETILEVGWSMWDTVSQKHRTRHWIIKENLNKCNGRYISDHRSNFLFGTSDKGSLEKAMNALQDEVDNLGITEGLNKQQQDALMHSGVTLVLVGHGMAADVDKAEVLEIEWPEGMAKFDTQELYMAWQLKQLDANAATRALEAVVACQNGQAKAAAAAAVAAVDVHDLDHPSDDDDDWVHHVPSEEEGATKSEAVENGNHASSPANTSSPSTGKKKGKPQVQNPPRVRPWPAGPPTDPNRPGSAVAEEKDQGPPNGDNGLRVDHQVSLAALCGALGIKTSKLHNAGNDARFTMEAFLALTGHEVCSDPYQAHLDFSKNDPRYHQQLQASLAAAAALGFGTPTEPTSSTTAPRSGSVGRGRSGRPGSATTSENGSCHDHDIALRSHRPAAGHPAVPPGFAAKAAQPSELAAEAAGPPGFAAPARKAVTVPPPGYAAAAAATPDDDVPPGFHPARNASPMSAAAPVAKAWGPAAAAAKAWGPGACSSAVVAPPAGSWAQRAGSGPAAAGSPRTAAAGMATHKPGSQMAWKVDPLAYGSDSSNASAAGSRAAPQPRQVAGRTAAFNSSTDKGCASAAYEPNPDGW